MTQKKTKITSMNGFSKIKNWQIILGIIIMIGPFIGSIFVNFNNKEATKEAILKAKQTHKQDSTRYSKEVKNFYDYLDTLSVKYYIVNKTDLKLQKYVNRYRKNRPKINGVISTNDKKADF